MNNANPELTVLYQAATTQSNHEGSLIWQRFSAFMVFHAIIFALIGELFTSSKSENLHILFICLSLFGLLICIIWLISTMRGFDALEYWQLSAIELANKMPKLKGEKLLHDYYERGYKFFKLNEKVTFDFGYETKEEANQLIRTDCSKFYSELKSFRTSDKKHLSINTKQTAYFMHHISIYFIFINMSCFDRINCKT